MADAAPATRARRRLYALRRVADGAPATDADARELAARLCDRLSRDELVALLPVLAVNARLWNKRTGPCDRCGCRESPAWRPGGSRRGVLCNACASRAKRTDEQ